MCECLKEAKAKLEETLRAEIKPESVYSYDKIGFDNEVFQLPNFNKVLILPFSIEYHAKKKDGSRAANLTKVKTGISFGFCPFCGTKYKD